jgi:menaquinone-dependent protoporphyrinogen oxidase
MRVLVGYASAKGSTREIAERIATRLRAAGHVTAVDRVDEASAIASYDALVLGSAIHNG